MEIFTLQEIKYDVIMANDPSELHFLEGYVTALFHSKKINEHDYESMIDYIKNNYVSFNDE